MSVTTRARHYCHVTIHIGVTAILKFEAAFVQIGICRYSSVYVAHGVNQATTNRFCNDKRTKECENKGRLVGERLLFFNGLAILRIVRQ
jgi:hypothetical protein